MSLNSEKVRFIKTIIPKSPNKHHEFITTSSVKKMLNDDVIKIIEKEYEKIELSLPKLIDKYNMILYSITNSIIWQITNNQLVRADRRRYLGSIRYENTLPNYKVKCVCFDTEIYDSYCNNIYNINDNIRIIDNFFMSMCKLIKKLLDFYKPEYKYKLKIGKIQKYCIIEVKNGETIECYIYINFKPTTIIEIQKTIKIQYFKTKNNLNTILKSDHGQLRILRDDPNRRLSYDSNRTLSSIR